MFMDINHPDAMYSKVTLNGELTPCVAADDEAGWVECYDYSSTKPKTFRKYGRVRIVTVKKARGD